MAKIQRAVPGEEYRPDVDGLRAIAVIAVLIFHAFPSLCPGGFVGVDVFFVISGFLITGIIYRGIQSGSFTISGFYLRRIRRIFPALLVMLVCFLVAGWILFIPSDLTQLGRNTAAAAGFSANLFYWAESGYFDTAALTKPLLHLWSLGIEEQFYLIWPLFVLLTARMNKSRQAALVVILLSFILCVVTTAPLSSSAFYDPAARMWQLGFGGFLALTLGSKKKQAGQEETSAEGLRLLKELSSLTGLALILAACWALDGGMPYPGWRALLPTVGTGLIIAAGESAFVNRWLLSHPIMVFVGLISYPLYLWHWPLLSFAQIQLFGVVPAATKVALLLASVALASATYLFLERPFRHMRLNWKMGGGLAATMLCVGVAGGSVYANRGMKWDAHSPHVLADSHPVNVPDKAEKASPIQPTSSTENLATSLPKPIEGRDSDSTSDTKTVSASKTDAAAKATPVPSRFMLYRQHVAEAMRAHPEDPEAYITEMRATLGKAVRAGICDADPSAEAPEFLKGSTCGQPVDGAKNILIMGDSIASDVYAWMHMAYPEYNIIQRTANSCSLLGPPDTPGVPKLCAAIESNALEIALSPTAKLDAVVLAGFWNPAIAISPSAFGSTYITSVIDKLLARGRKVVLVGPPVGFIGILARDIAERCPSSSKDGPTPAELDQCAREHSTPSRKASEVIKQYARQKGIAYVDLFEVICNDRECPILNEDGQLLFVDSVHRSVYGDSFIAQRIRENHVFERILDAK